MKVMREDSTAGHICFPEAAKKADVLDLIMVKVVESRGR